jgi:hypothetical protein
MADTFVAEHQLNLVACRFGSMTGTNGLFVDRSVRLLIESLLKLHLSWDLGAYISAYKFSPKITFELGSWSVRLGV